MAIINDLDDFETGANPEHKKSAERNTNIAQISLKLESDLLDTIKRAARADGRIILSEYIRVLIVAGLEAKGINAARQ